MSLTSSLTASRHRYHVDAYDFVFESLRHAQELLERVPLDDELEFEGEESHVTGPELLNGVRKLALDQFGLMARIVFASWGITCTEDFGRIVFELIEQGRMKKTDRDRLSDFSEVFDFEEAFDLSYRPQTEIAPIVRGDR